MAEQAELREAALASQVVRMLLESIYLSPGDHEIAARRIDHAEETNAMGVLLDILNGGKLAATLPASFDGTVRQHDGFYVFPGAILLGRLFSYVVRGVGMKNRTIDGALVPVDIASISYAELNDAPYMHGLMCALTRTGHCGLPTWTIEAESYHMSRGVEAFFRGCLSITVSSNPAALHFMGSITDHRDRLCGQTSESASIFKEQFNGFQYCVLAGRGAAQPIMINKPTGSESRTVKLSYVRQHLWEVKAKFDSLAGPCRKRPRVEMQQPLAGAQVSTSVETLEEERARQRAVQRLRAQAATTSLAPSTAIQSSAEGVSKFDIYSETPLNQSIYDRFMVEQTRLADRLRHCQYRSLETGTPVTFVHDMTPMGTPTNISTIEKRDNRRNTLEDSPQSESLKLLERYRLMKTIPIYISTGPSDQKTTRPLAGTPFDVDTLSQHTSNMELLSRVFSEVRRVTTLMYLLWDEEIKEELKNAKLRIAPKESFLKLLNAGRDNNGFVFNLDGEDAYEPSDHLPEAATPFTMADAEELTQHLNVAPSATTAAGRVAATLLRVPKLWETGMETVEDTGRVAAMYAYASSHEVGVNVAGAYVFNRLAMFDTKLVLQWNLLYDASLTGEQLSDDDKQQLSAVRGYIVKTRKHHEWFDELQDTTAYRSYNDTPAAVSTAPDESAYGSFDELLNLSPRHYDVDENTIAPSTNHTYQVVKKFRLWRRTHVLETNARIGSTVSRAEKLARLSEPDQLDRAWFIDTFGCSPDVYEARTVACGARASKILTVKDISLAQVNTAELKAWGTMFVNERMLYEFGQTGHTPPRSVMQIAQTAMAKHGKPTIAGAKSQFERTKSYLDATWKLLSKMSSIGLLNTDAHLGNYMITEYDTSHTKHAKIIDFDSSYTTVFRKEDFEGDDNSTNSEGWKPLYVLNVLVVLYTLSQDMTRSLLFGLLKNATRVDASNSYIDGTTFVLETERQVQFRGIVMETIRALEKTPRNKMSVPQKLLAATWRGGYKGMGNPADLNLPTAFFSNGSVRVHLLKIAEYRNDLKNVVETNEEYKAVIRGKIKKRGKAIRNSSADGAVELLNNEDIAAASDILMVLDQNMVSSNRQAPKIPTAGATHTNQMEWALRQNIFSRGFFEPAEFVCTQWSERQKFVDLTIDRSNKEEIEADDSRQLMRPSTLAELVAKMTPSSIGQFNSIQSMFDNVYRTSIAPGMHHTVTPRADDYRIIDLLRDYVFSPTHERPINSGAERGMLMPRYSDTKNVISNATAMSRSQRWRRHVPNHGRGILSLPSL